MEDLEETWWEKLSTTMVRIKSTTYFRAGWPVSRPVQKVGIRPSSMEKPSYLYGLILVELQSEPIPNVSENFLMFSSHNIFIFFSLSLKYNLIDSCLHTQWHELQLGAYTLRKTSGFERSKLLQFLTIKSISTWVYNQSNICINLLGMFLSGVRTLTKLSDSGNGWIKTKQGYRIYMFLVLNPACFKALYIYCSINKHLKIDK